jgi:hypothetical protein
MTTLTIKDLSLTGESGRKESTNARPLSSDEMRRILGGRSMVVKVDNRNTGTVDDFAVNMAIFEGRIQGPYLL